MIDTFYSHGKLLLTGEYFVLDGALALALPCKLGQSMTVETIGSSVPVLKWKSLDHENKTWFEAIFDLKNLDLLNHSDQQTADTLQQILKAARTQNSSFLKPAHSFQVETKLEFPRLWGLGSSSTLINNIAQWSQTDAFQLLSETMGGSGYDIACAGAEGSILYKKTNGKPIVEKCNFNPPFRDQLYFVYLGKKQNSREGIQYYREKINDQPQLIEQVSVFTKAVLSSKNLSDFENLLLDHENLISKTLDLPRIQDQYFSNFSGIIKSLGAWGGDFVLAVSKWGDVKTKKYFNEKRFDVFLNYNELIL
jgi:mevalonate kinase